MIDSKWIRATLLVAIALTAVCLGSTAITSDTEANTTETNPGETEIPVESVKISKDSLKLYVGDSDQLTADVRPYNASNSTVTWSSSKSSVATVSSSGLVKAVGDGTATITASAGGKSDTCTVTVTQVTLTLDRSEITTITGYQPEVKITVTPRGLLNDVSVSVASSGIASAYLYGDTCTISGDREGQTTVTFKLKNVTRTCSIDVLAGSCHAYDNSSSKRVDIDIEEKLGVKVLGESEYYNGTIKGSVKATVSSSSVKDGSIAAASQNQLIRCINAVESVAGWAPTTIEIDYGTSSTVTVPATLMKSIADAGMSLETSSTTGGVSLGSSTMGKMPGSDWSYSIGKVDNDTGLEGATVYVITMKSGSSAMTSFPGSAKVRLPYELGDGMTAFGVKAYTVDGKGTTSAAVTSYDSINELVELSTNSVTKFAVTYDGEEGGSNETSSLGYVAIAVLAVLSVLAVIFSYRYLRM